MSEEYSLTEKTAEEAPEKPSVLRIVVPFVTTALIFWWILRGLNFEALKRAFSEARLGLVLPAITIYSIVFFLIDVASFGLAYKKYLTDKVSWRDIAVVRGGMYLIQVALAPVAEVIPPTYFARKWRVRVLHTLGSEMYVMFCDAYQNVTLLSMGLLVAGVSLGLGWLIFVIAMWIWLGVNFAYWLTPIHDRLLPRLHNAAILHAFKKAPLKDYLIFYGLRGIFMPANVIIGWVLLDAFNVHLPIQHLLLLSPVMMSSTFLPISAGGYGGPQGAAILVLVNMYHHTTVEVAVAYSLIWSTFFAIGRAVIGAVFAIPVWNLLGQDKEKVE